MADKRKVLRWVRTTKNVSLSNYIYRRESFVYRRLTKHFLTREEARGLLQQMADLFSYGHAPQLHFRVANDLGANFRVCQDGRTRITIRCASERKFTHEGLDARCNLYDIEYKNVPLGRVQAQSLVHEFAHYLAWLWFADGSHDSKWEAVNAALCGWYARSRKFKGTTCRVTIRRDKVKKLHLSK